jgi:hypothetical protein
MESSELANMPISIIDSILTAQITVGWAGEAGDEARLGWWRSAQQEKPSHDPSR